MEPKASLPSVTPQAPQPEKGLEFREKFPVSEGDCPQEPFAHSFTPSLAQHRHRQPHVGNYGALYLFVLPRVNSLHTPLVPEGRGRNSTSTEQNPPRSSPGHPQTSPSPSRRVPQHERRASQNRPERGKSRVLTPVPP